MLIDSDTSRARRAELVDKLAAAWILQGVLDRLADLTARHRPIDEHVDLRPFEAVAAARPLSRRVRT